MCVCKQAAAATVAEGGGVATAVCVTYVHEVHINTIHVCVYINAILFITMISIFN